MITHTLFDNIDAVIFDMDGTLLDSMWVWEQVDIDYMREHELEFVDDYRDAIEGMTFDEVAAYTKERFDLADSVETIMDEWNDMAFDQYANHVALKPGVRNLLESLREQGIKMGIATSNCRMLTEAVLKSHDVGKLFGAVLTSEDIVKGKPAPDIYLRVAELLGVEPKRCLVFEDVVMGIQAGKSAGMRVCAIDDPHSAHTTETKIELADAFIHSFEEVLP